MLWLRESISYIGSEKVEFSVIVKPTILTGKPQTIMSLGNKEINIDGEGQVCWTVASTELVAPGPISLNWWYKIAAMIDAYGRMTLRVDQIRNSAGDESLSVEAKTDIAPALDGTLFLARRTGGSVAQFFNGRIEAPALSVDGVVVERWNLADEMTSLRVPSALGAAGQELRLVNAPVRAVRCSLWDASEMCWRHKPRALCSDTF